HGSANTGPPSSRGKRGSTASASGGLKIVVPQRDHDGVLGFCLFAPQFACRETNRVNVLRLLAQALGIGVGEHEHAVVALDDAELSARVAREARMHRRVDVAGADALTNLERR